MNLNFYRTVRSYLFVGLNGVEDRLTLLRKDLDDLIKDFINVFSTAMVNLLYRLVDTISEALDGLIGAFFNSMRAMLAAGLGEPESTFKAPEEDE